MAPADADADDNPGSVTLLLGKTMQGDEAAANLLLQKLQSKYADRLTANLKKLQAADRDAIAAEMLFRLYKGLIEGRFSQPRNRGDLFKLIGGINRMCRHENWKRQNTLKARTFGTTPLPESWLSTDEAPPDELTEVEDFVQQLAKRVDKHIASYPKDAFLRPMLAMILEDRTREEIMAAHQLSRHKYQTRLDLLIGIGREWADGTGPA
ncbi:MAG: ECF-type sigma factor [Planctomycetaceae bacterium]